MITTRLIAAAAFALGLTLCGAPALAQAPQTATPAPSPSASATPSGPTDPCGSLLSIVNRPTISTGVCTVQTGHFVVENGYQNTVTTGPGGGNTAIVGQNDAGIRIGTFDPHFDLEFTPPNYAASTVGGSRVTGSTDMTLGAKYELGYTSNALYGIAGFVTLPSGTPAFTAGNAQFTGDFNWGYTINSVFGVNGTFAVNALSGINSGGQPQSYFAFVPSIEATAALPGSPSELFAEYAYFSQAGPNLGSKNVFDFGYMRDFGQHVQLDIEYGFSPTSINGKKQHYIGAGLSFMN
ncbi:MAG TPA: hypothetical protein VFE36_03675 [Candidatus Baltobacteraceae bacterium]|nr:hypothetical protein [Candidatus Baltobacteraceae bacterium]